MIGNESIDLSLKNIWESWFTFRKGKYRHGYYRKFIVCDNKRREISANIYLNELDRFIKHQLKPKAYLRYGDDFILIENDFEKLKLWPSGRTLNKRSLKRATERLNYSNVSSYNGLIKKHCNRKYQKYFNWMIYEKIFTK